MTQSPSDLVGGRLVQVVVPVAPPKSATARYGTILYVGPVAGTKSPGDWLGIEWDDAAKGRHDGEHKGRRYFQTSRAGAGSFLRATTLDDGATFVGGRPFLAAVRERYLGEDQGAPSQAPAPLSRRNLAEIDIEAPNMDKVRTRVGQLAKLKVVSLTGPMELSEEDVRQLEEQGRVGPTKEELIDVARGLPGAPVDEAEAKNIGETLSSLEHLDVSRTLVPSWQRVASIVRHLPRLRTLYLHHNRLALPTTTDFTTLAASQGLQHLVELGLDRTRTSWRDVVTLAPYMSQVRTLQLAGNDIESLDVPETPALANLEELNLEGNRLTSFGNLAALPSLKRLHLSHNSIASVAATDRRFPVLEHISLTGNALFGSDATDLWESLSHLDAAVVGGLRSLSVQQQDISSLALPASQLHLHLIARLPSLAVLNGSPITALQRRDAELWWLAQPECNDEASKATALRLRKAHAASEDTQPSTVPNDTPAIATNARSKLATVTLHHASHPPDSSREPSSSLNTTSFSLLPTMALRTLRPKLLRSLGLPPRSSAHFYALMRSSDGDGSIVIELDDDSMPLNRYGLETGRTGDEIWVIPE